MKLVHYVSKDGKEHTVNFGRHSEYIVILDDGDTAEDELLDGFQVDSESEFDSTSNILPTGRVLTS